jgi:hypothetical protein
MGGGITCVQPRLQQRRQSKKRLTQKGGLLSNEEISGYYRRKNISDVIVKERDKRINNIVKIIVENEKNAEEYSNTNVNISDECSTEICSNKCDPMIDVECSTQSLGRKGSKSGRRGKQLGDEIELEEPGDESMGMGRLNGGAIKLKENKKIILGKERCIYTKKGTKKEYIKYKNEYIGLKEFIKLKSIEQQSKTPKKTQAAPKTTKKTQAEPKTAKKTQAEPKTAKKTQAAPKTPKKTQAAPKTTKKTQAEPKTAKKTQAEPKTAKKTQAEPKTAKKTQAEPKTTKKTQAEPKTTKKTQAEPKTAKKTQAAPKTAKKTQAVPKTAKKTQAAPKTAKKTQAAPKTAKKTQAESKTAKKTQAEPNATTANNKKISKL